MTPTQDILSGISRWRLWTLLAYEDFKATYHRTLIGPIWVIASFLAFIGVKVFIFGTLNTSSDNNYYICYLTLGFMMWTFLANAINGGINGFVSAKNWIHGISAPYSIFVLERLTGGLINLFFVAIASLAITMFFQPFTIVEFTLAILGFCLVLFSLFWVALLLAIIGVFFRDAIQLVGTIMRIAFFLTPILWLPEALGSRAVFVNWNPFTHYLALVRAPLIDGTIPELSLYVVAGITAITMVLSLSAFKFYRKYIPSYI